MKRILNGYVKNNTKTPNSVTYNKKNFIPFVDERDHLGNLIDSQVRTELGGHNYIKKLVIFQPRKRQDKIEIREDIPRRWLEQVGGSEGQISGRRGSFDGVLAMNGMQPPDKFSTNDMAASDGHDNFGHKSL